MTKTWAIANRSARAMAQYMIGFGIIACAFGLLDALSGPGSFLNPPVWYAFGVASVVVGIVALRFAPPEEDDE